MKYLRVILITATLLLFFAACGNSNTKSSEDTAEPAASPTQSKAVNEISAVFSDQEEYSPGAFELKKTLAFISGMRYNGKSTAKHVYIAFANYDAQLGPYAVDVPKEPGQIVIVVSFKTENKETPLEQQMDEYAKMTVPTGTYEPGWMASGRCFQVHYFVGGQEGGPSISDQGAAGTGSLTTSTAEKVSGTIDFTSPKGSTIKGTFEVKIEKDLWKN